MRYERHLHDVEKCIKRHSRTYVDAVNLGSQVQDHQETSSATWDGEKDLFWDGQKEARDV